jgi:hypothetical protein
MAEAYPYHPAEHYEVPKDSMGVLQDTLRIYPTSDELYMGLRGLHAIYGRTPVVLDLIKFAKFTRLAAKSAHEDSYPDINLDDELEDADPFIRETAGANRDFYLGQVLATHTFVGLTSKLFRRQILGQLVFDPMKGGETDMDGKDEELQNRLREMDDFRVNGWQKAYQAFYDDEEKAVLSETAARLAGNSDSHSERAFDFIAGYTFGNYQLLRLAQREPAQRHYAWNPYKEIL